MLRIILLSSISSNNRSVNVNGWIIGLSFFIFLILSTGLGTIFGYKLSDLHWQLVFENTANEIREQIELQSDNVAVSREKVEQTLAAMTIKLAQMRSRLVRLDALGEQLTQVANLKDGEFDFSSSAGLGGPERALHSELSDALSPREEIELIFASLENNLGDREAQLSVLQSMMSDNRLKTESVVAGRPIVKGWLSSNYGMRTDPFHGRKSWHNGVDFAGREGSDIIAVASGVVVWSGTKKGYGKMIEINHSDGYLTRYAHNRENLAKVGALVKRGDVIASMGNTGRSTGPHVHFEVYKDGRTVNPANYIRRTVN